MISAAPQDLSLFPRPDRGCAASFLGRRGPVLELAADRTADLTEEL